MAESAELIKRFLLSLQSKNVSPHTLRAYTADLKEFGDYVSKHGLSARNFFERNNLRYQTIQSFKDFHVTGLTLPFINKKTRNGVLQNTYLIKLN
jgi:site-specific recombinase XerD